MKINQNIKDLAIENDILPLFNVSNNQMTEGIIKNILRSPLSSPEAIIERQEILKGFIANYDMLKTYNYSRSELMEVSAFIANHTVSKPKGPFFGFFNPGSKYTVRNQYAQFVLFFDALEKKWIKETDKRHFPRSYSQNFEEIEAFIARFKFQYYAGLIHNQKFKQKHIINLANKIDKANEFMSWQSFWNKLFLFEAYVSISIGIKKNNFVFPVMSDRGINIENFFYPRIKHPVKNSISVNRNVVLLTGPNMSGKSTLLRALGLSVLLTQCGLAIPASSAAISFFDHIHIFVNHNDDLSNGYSHFMNEIQTLKSIINQVEKGKKCFVIFDELFKGTNSQDAIAITNTTIDGLRKFTSSCFFVSTHLHELKSASFIKNNMIETYYIDCIIEKGAPKFTYKLNTGWSDLKIGQIIFESEGLSALLAND